MTAVLASSIMEFNSDSPLQHHVGVLKQEHVATQSCASQASAWGKQDSITNSNKRRLSNVSNETSQSETEQEPFLMQKKIKTEPKDDYELAEEECARRASDSSLPQTEANIIAERWKYEQNHSASPVFDRVPSFAADECHQFNSECKQCVINEARQVDVDSTSLHRRRQIREFEQGSEEPLSNKIRVWKEKRLEKSQVVRGIPRNALRLEDDECYQRPEEDGISQESRDEPAYEHHSSRDDPRAHQLMHHETSREQVVVPLQNHIMSPREQHVMSPGQHVMSTEHVTPRGRVESPEAGNDGYIRYLLTRNNPGAATIVSTEGDVEMQRSAASVAMPVTTMPMVLTSPGVGPPEYINGMGSVYPRVSVPRTVTTAAKTQSKVAKKRTRQQATGSNFLERLEKARHASPPMASSNKNKGNKKSFDDGADVGMYQDDINRGQFGQGSTILSHIASAPDTQDTITEEQYISDIQRPYCNIPDDHQVTHINGVMSLPATRETRYGITLGELKRRTGFPEYLTRVDLIAYVRQSKSAGRALLDKYSISTAGQKSRPTILSKMCENEARVLGDGICRMNTEYFPWKTLAKIAANKVTEKTSDDKVEHKLKAIQNTRTMLKEMYDLMVENKDIACMKTFEVASHTFGTANILNHLTVFDRLFAEYQNDLIRNNNQTS